MLVLMREEKTTLIGEQLPAYKRAHEAKKPKVILHDPASKKKKLYFSERTLKTEASIWMALLLARSALSSKFKSDVEKKF